MHLMQYYNHSSIHSHAFQSCNISNEIDSKCNVYPSTYHDHVCNVNQCITQPYSTYTTSCSNAINHAPHVMCQTHVQCAITHAPTGIVYALPEHIPIGHVPVLTHTLLGLWATNPMEASHQSCAGLRSFTDGLHPNLLSVPLFPKPILTRKSLLTHHGPMPYPTRANSTHTMPNSHYANPCHDHMQANMPHFFSFHS